MEYLKGICITYFTVLIYEIFDLVGVFFKKKYERNVAKICDFRIRLIVGIVSFLTFRVQITLALFLFIKFIKD